MTTIRMYTGCTRYSRVSWREPFAIPAPDGSLRVLAVLRPPDDPELPGVWGLPAAGVRAGEDLETAARRAGRDKLGVELGGLRTWRSGATERPGYRLEMCLFRARIAGGEPDVPQPVPGVTQYVEWRWAEPEVLEPAAELGSLCCHLFLGGTARHGE
jgi:ADP-ribose pyrophosphatase YjhB (NUDIX family)